MWKLGVPNRAGALLSPVCDFVLQLIRENVSDSQLVYTFKQSCKGLRHIQGGGLPVFVHLQAEVRSPNLSCGGQGSKMLVNSNKFSLFL